MGILDLFNRKTEVSPGIQLSRKLAPYWPQLQTTLLPYIKIEATPAAHLSPAQSKFGGAPLLPAHIPWPTDSNGKRMFPLAQINFAEVPQLEGFPTQGWLQFYISTNDNFGIDFMHRTSQKDFRVLYFKEIDQANVHTDFDFINQEKMYDNAPVAVQHALHFSSAQGYVGAQDIRFKKAFGMSAKRLAESMASPNILEELHAQFPAYGHKVGGYAYFGDRDPRGDRTYQQYIPGFDEYILLLQIASVPNSQSEAPDIMWANNGVGNFFIHPDHLRQLDFSSVAYNWDSQKEEDIDDPQTDED